MHSGLGHPVKPQIDLLCQGGGHHFARHLFGNSGHIHLLQQRQQLQAQMDAAMAEVDMLLLPTIAITAPRIADLLDDDNAFFAANGLILRNTSIFNFYDLPALSLPAPRASGELPVGIMLVGQRMQDRNLLAMAAAVEQSLL